MKSKKNKKDKEVGVIISPTVDVAVFNEEINKLLLIKRLYPPYKSKYCLPGGFVESYETLKHAAIRELYEETNIKVSNKNMNFFGVFDDPKRDPRIKSGIRTITFVFFTMINEEMMKRVKAKDDAKEIYWFSLKDVKKMIKENKFGFDHGKIIREIIRFFRIRNKN